MSDNKHTTPTSGGDQYGRCLLLSLLAVMTVLTPAELKAQSMAGQTNGLPKLVVNILVDQLRDDYLEAFMPLYGNDGFKRLFKDGVYVGEVYTHLGTDKSKDALHESAQELLDQLMNS